MQERIETLKKIKALADKGSPGEKETARKKLEELCKKYKIRPEMLEQEQKYSIFIMFENMWEAVFACKIVQMVTDAWDIEYDITSAKIKTALNRKKITFKLSKAEIAELNFLFPHYRKILCKQFIEFTHAFCINSNIQPLTAEYTGELKKTDNNFESMLSVAKSIPRPAKQIEG